MQNTERMPNGTFKGGEQNTERMPAGTFRAK